MKQHSPRFLAASAAAKSRIQEVSVSEVKAKLDRKEPFLLIDVREDREWHESHITGAIHLGKGVMERDIEHVVPDVATPLVLYCGGGHRSAMAADSLQNMGYQNVLSMDGGYRAWSAASYPVTKQS